MQPFSQAVKKQKEIQKKHWFWTEVEDEELQKRVTNFNIIDKNGFSRIIWSKVMKSSKKDTFFSDRGRSLEACRIRYKTIKRKLKQVSKHDPIANKYSELEIKELIRRIRKYSYKNKYERTTIEWKLVYKEDKDDTFFAKRNIDSLRAWYKHNAETFGITADNLIIKKRKQGELQKKLSYLEKIVLTTNQNSVFSLISKTVNDLIIDIATEIH